MKENRKNSIKVGAAMVLGGGIGGMEAALSLAESGIKVYLVDGKPAIGGVMSQLDKTFPTNDCAMCTMAPRLVSIGRHKDIEILSMSEVERIEGEPGNFTITLTRKSRFVDEERCTGCGTCVSNCPTRNWPPGECATSASRSRARYSRSGASGSTRNWNTADCGSGLISGCRKMGFLPEAGRA